MAKDIDVYRDWLGVKETNRPLNHYQLLLLPQFEDDAEKIRKNYRKLNAEVRKYASGDYAKLSQELLNEMAKAMLLLTDAQRKREYDATLGRKDKKTTKRQTFEELLLYRNVVDQAQLDKARKFSNAVGMDLRDSLINQKIAPAEKVVPLYAEANGLPYVDLNDVVVDESLIDLIPTRIARASTCAPIQVDDGKLLIVSPHPISEDLEHRLRMQTGLAVLSVLCTPAGANAIVGKYYTKEREEAEALAERGAKKTVVDPNAPVENSEERATRHRNIALVAFALPTAGYQFIFNSQFDPMKFVVAIVIGATCAGISYGAAKLLNL